jgi:ribosome-binding factor A
MTRRKSRSARSAGGEQNSGSGQLRHLLAQLLRDGSCRDPALQQASITVSEVRISPDLRNATAYVMPLGGANVGDVLAGLKRGAPFLRSRLAHELSLRYAPDLVFALDETFDQADRISSLLARPEVARDLQAQTAGDEDGDAV